MQPVSRLAPARPHARVGTTTSKCQARAAATTSRGCAWPCRRVAPAPRLRARATSCGGRGTTEPVEAREDNAEPAAVDEAEAGLAPEELEVLEEAAIAGVDEGRRPTDYDRRAHIFEESSRVFRELKHQRDGDGGGGHGGVADAATAAGTGTREHQQLG
ncbi:hypothetical protein SEVIR_9G418000v4 [Setaria viridis]|uniref:Uncharacterized protein n=2 Tax=Setaria TaxID=4554 RepID=K4AG49_SETIT|nr:uncharacterized protein LOC101761753 [Setaria italica]XP_034575943.1 uncharacterized protein LOC117839659 [Setaria viridis]RCV44924.1 hypothetical protein SETIT_9G413800v2 [Setaria italica]TKV96255.1 hypothetical protein SEVIR_9G418000v2 [Setaria viridis]